MTDIAARPAPEGWYPDPAGSGGLRWWNGAVWTEHTRAAPQPAPDDHAPEAGAGTAAETARASAAPASAAGDENPFPSRRQLRARWLSEGSTGDLHEELTGAGRSNPSAQHSVPPEFLMPREDEPALNASEKRGDSGRQANIPVGIPVGPNPASNGPGTELTPLTAQALEAIMARAERHYELAASDGSDGSDGARPFTMSSTPAKSSPAAPSSAISQLTDVPERGSFVPFATHEPPNSLRRERPENVNTLSAWVLAVMPVLYPLVLVAVIFSLDLYLPAVQLGITAVFGLWMVLLAVRDARELRRSGHLRVASPLWILLTPLAYLIVRSVRVTRETGHGAGPLILWSVLTAALVVVSITSPVLIQTWK